MISSTEIYSKLEKYVTRFYKEGSKDNPDLNRPTREELMILYENYSMKDLISLLGEESQERISKMLSGFNKEYKSVCGLVKDLIEKGSQDFMRPLVLLCNIFNDSHSITKGFRIMKDKEYIGLDVSWYLIYPIVPNWFTNEEVATAVHILNNTLNKLNFEDHPGLYDLFKDPTPILKKEKNLEERCGDFLMKLPEEITLDNWIQFVEFCKNSNLPVFEYNLNGALTYKLMEINKIRNI